MTPEEQKRILNTSRTAAGEILTTPMATPRTTTPITQEIDPDELEILVTESKE